MSNTSNKNLTHNSQKLRKNMTPEELKLWVDFLQPLPVTVNRQKVIDNFIVDFYCAEYRLIIEIDGAQHYSEEGEVKDKGRDARLKELGYTVLRYTNIELHNNFKGVCEDILRYIKIYE